MKSIPYTLSKQLATLPSPQQKSHTLPWFPAVLETGYPSDSKKSDRNLNSKTRRHLWYSTMEVGRDPITYKLRLTSYVRSNSKLQSSLPAFCVTKHILPRLIPLPLSFYSCRCCFYNAVSKTECVWTAYLFDSSLVNLEFWWKANVRGYTVLDFGKREWRISVEFQLNCRIIIFVIAERGVHLPGKRQAGECCACGGS
jgi:hypothetical protein